MKWIKRTLLTLPFMIAALLNVLVISADSGHLPHQRIDGFAFLFSTPWGWLLDHDWVWHTHSRVFDNLITLAVLLWFPAALYSGCIWLLLRAGRLYRFRRSR